jgi:type IV pilus assembly protein PilW
MTTRTRFLLASSTPALFGAARRSAQRGVTLIELMIAIAIAMLMAALSAQIALMSKGTFGANAAKSRLQEMARFATTLIAHDLRMSGFRGCTGTAGTLSSTLNAGSFQFQFDQPLTASFGTGSSFSPALDASLSALAPAPSPSSDVLTVRVPASGSQALLQQATSGTAALQIGAGSGFANSDIVMVGTCGRAVVFQITADPSGGTIAHTTATATPGNASGDFQWNFGQTASVYRLTTRTYYVAPSTLKPGTNSLYVYADPDYTSGSPAINSGIGQEIVEGVDQMKISFGIDSDGDGAANVYLPATGVTNWNQVVSAHLQLLMATTQDGVTLAPQAYSFPSGAAAVTPTDRRMRVALSSVISIRNLLQ